MADGSFPTLVSKDRDANASTNPIFVRLTDGTNNIPVGGGTEATALRVTIANDSTGVLSVDDNGGSITVDGTVTLGANSGVDIGDVDVTSVVPGTGASNLGKAEDAVHGSGDVGVMALAVRRDTATAGAADGDYATFNVNSTGKLYVTLDGETVTTSTGGKTDDSAFSIGVDTVSPSGFLADETATDSVDEGDVGLARMTLDRKILTRITGATDSNRWDIDSSGHGQMDLAAVSVTAVPVSKNGSANSEANPIFVQSVSSGVSSTEVHDYNTAASVAGDGTSNHDYTVAGTTFLLKSVIFAASGNIKVEIQTGPVASLVTKAVAFLNGRNGDSKQINFDPPIEVPATSTGTVRVIRTNRQGQAQDVYSTIIGNDIP